MCEPVDGDTAIARYNALVDRTNALLAEVIARMAAQPHLISETVERTTRQARQARRPPKVDE